MAPVEAFEDYYFLLGVPPKAKREEIKTSFRRLALLTHPDKDFISESATARMQEVSDSPFRYILQSRSLTNL